MKRMGQTAGKKKPRNQPECTLTDEDFTISIDNDKQFQVKQHVSTMKVLCRLDDKCFDTMCDEIGLISLFVKLKFVVTWSSHVCDIILAMKIAAKVIYVNPTRGITLVEHVNMDYAFNEMSQEHHHPMVKKVSKQFIDFIAEIKKEHHLDDRIQPSENPQTERYLM